MAAVVMLAPFATYAAPAAQAQSPWYNYSFDEFYAMVYDSDIDDSELFGERYTAAQVNWIIWAMLGFLLNMVGRIGGADPQNFTDCVVGVFSSDNPITNLTSIPECILWVGDVAFRFDNLFSNAEIVSPLASILDRPVSSVAYFQDIASRLHIVPEAQAQGFGFGAANSVLELWKVSRDITYSLLIFVIVIMAFMIMFRIKLSPQVVITVQSALPKIVITLVLITFSYAIAGLLIDLMYVVIGLLAAILVNADISLQTWEQTFSQLTYGDSAMMLLLKYLGLFIIGAIWAMFSTPWFFTLLPIIASILAIVIVIIMVIILAVRVTWMLVKNFVMILFNIIFSPFVILGGAIGYGGFGGWVRTMVSLLAVYPVVGLLFVIAFMFIQAMGMTTLIGPGVLENLMPFDIASNAIDSSWAPPLFVTDGGDMDFIWLFASVAVIAMIPKVPEAIKGAMSGKGFGYGSAIQEPIAGATRFAGGRASGALNPRLSEMDLMARNAGQTGWGAYGKVKYGSISGLKSAFDTVSRVK